MTTLADINQTLVDQGEKQERTVEAIESLVGRIADLVNFGGRGSDDQLDELEDRREKAAEERRNRMAGVGKVVSGVQQNSSLLMKLLAGGALVGLLAASSEEFREDIKKFAEETKVAVDAAAQQIKENSKLISELLTRLDNLLGPIDEILTGILLLTGTLRLLQILNAGKTFLGGGRGTIVEKRGARQAARQAQSAQRTDIRGPRRTGGGLDEARNLRNQQRAAVTRLNQANAAQQRFAGNQQRFSTAQRLTQLQQQPSLLQRTGNFLRGAGRIAGQGARIAGQGARLAGLGAAGAIPFLFAPSELADGSFQPEFSIETAIAKIEQGIPLHPLEEELMMGIDREQAQSVLDKTRFTPRFIMSEEMKQLVDENERLLNALDAFKGSSFSPGPTISAPIPTRSMDIMEATEGMGGANGGATVIQQDNSTNNFFNGGGGAGSTGGVVPLPSDINVQRLDILGNFGTGRLM